MLKFTKFADARLKLHQYRFENFPVFVFKKNSALKVLHSKF